MSFTDWKQTTIGNTFMFRLVMEKQELCKPLIERILGIKIKTIVYAEPEKSFEAKLASKGIRLDLYVVDEDGVAYDVEMQMNGDFKEFLGKRSRYYVSLMDNDALKKGEPYKNLRRTYVIFICKFDPFDKGLGKYTFSARCNEDNSLLLNDEINTVFVNTEGDRHKVSRELANIMEYISTGQAEDEYTRRLDEVVESLRSDDGKERLYMTYHQTIMEHEELARQQALQQGIKQGEKQGMEKGIAQATLASLEAMIEKFKISADDAMAVLNISKEDYAKYKKLLQTV